MVESIKNSDGKLAEDSEKLSGGEEEKKKPSPILRFGDKIARGRPKGVKNKIPKRAQEAIEAAFWEGGGVEWLVGLMHGTASDRAVFANLYGRLLPLQVNSNIDQKIRIEAPWLFERNIGKTSSSDNESVANAGKALPDQRVTDGEFVEVSRSKTIGYSEPSNGAGSSGDD